MNLLTTRSLVQKSLIRKTLACATIAASLAFIGNSMRRKILAVAAALVLGTASMTPDTMAAGRGGGAGGGGGGGYGFSGGYRGHGVAMGHGSSGHFGGFRGGRFVGGFGFGDGPYYGYDYGPSDAFGDDTSDTPPPVGFVAEQPHAPIICKETVTVPSQDGGTRQIRIIRC